MHPARLHAALARLGAALLAVRALPRRLAAGRALRAIARPLAGRALLSLSVLGVVARLAVLVGLPRGLLGRRLTARLGQAAVDGRALLLDDPVERLAQLVDDLAEVVPIEPLLPGLPDLLEQLAQALQPLAVRPLEALAHELLERPPGILAVDQAVGQLVEELVGVDREPLGPVPARVGESTQQHPNLPGQRAVPSILPDRFRTGPVSSSRCSRAGGAPLWRTARSRPGPARGSGRASAVAG